MSILNMSFVQAKRQLVSTRIAAFLVLLVFVKMLVSEPIEAAVEQVCAVDNGVKGSISFFQNFICLGCSGFVALIMPLSFLLLISGIPSEESFDLFVHIRTYRKKWLVSQFLTIGILAAAFMLLLMLFSGLLTGRYADLSMDYCYSITHYLKYFPEKRGEYVLELMPQNFYNQIGFTKALLMTAALLFLEFLFWGLFVHFFAVINMKFAGVVCSVVIIVSGTTLSSADMKLQWAFPIVHTVVWKHYDKMLQKMVFPVWASFAYFILLIIILIAANVVFIKKYRIGM